MEEFVGDLVFPVLFLTPLLVVVKVLHALIAQRWSFAHSRAGASVEAVAWPLLAAAFFHSAALLLPFSLQPQDVCTRYRPALGDDVYRTSGGVLEFPVVSRCVWASESVVVTPWWLNVLTAVFVLVTLAVAVLVVLRARRATSSGAQS